MSCEIKTVANIIDVPAVRRCLFPTDDLRGGDNWLQACKISVSPTSDLIAIANEKRLVVLSSKWNANNCTLIYQVSFSGCLNETDTIQSLLCIPVISQPQTSQVSLEWTCLVIGFESGFVRFYTENCTLLLEEQLHNECIVNIKCQSQHSPRPDINHELKPEEIYVQYVNCICIINGANLFTILRNCRNQLTKGSSSETNSLTVNPKKWGFQDQAIINDSAVIGLDLANTFNHLLTASTCGGFDTKYRTIAPHNNLVLGVGSKPYVGFHFATEGLAQPVLSDVAKAVTNKLKSAISGWLTGTKSQPDKQMILSLQPAEPMGCRFGLCDLRRAGGNVIISPNRKLAAVSDTLGRVILVDTLKGIAVRIFKGYRDAQCAFIQVADEKKTKKHKTQRANALFLVIYSPKKGTLEIFSAQQGTKIVTFTASKHSLLIYIGYGLLGFSTTSKLNYICQFTSLFVDADGQMKEILVPFHFALTEKNSKRARDLHLYKKLKQFIKNDDYDGEKLTMECVNTCAELKIVEIKLQCLNMLMHSKEMQPDVILKCANQFISTQNVDCEDDSDLKLLTTLAKNLMLVVNFYNYVSMCNQDDISQSNEAVSQSYKDDVLQSIENDVSQSNKNDVSESNENDVSQNNENCVSASNEDKLDLKNGNEPTSLSISLKDMQNLQKLLDLSCLTENNEIKVSFVDNTEYNVSKFLNVFNLHHDDKIFLKNNLDDIDLYQASETIYKKYILEVLCSQQFQGEIVKSKIVIDDLFKLVLIYWVNRPLKLNLNLEKEMNYFYNILYVLKTAMKLNDVVEYNNISPFWSTIRDILANSSRPFPSLMAAILCKMVAEKIEIENETNDNVEEDVWEKLSQEHCNWTLLIGKLEDISLLNIMLANKASYSSPSLPKLSHDKVDITLKYILEKGKGSISELVAQWLTMSGISPEELLLLQNVKNEPDETNSSRTERLFINLTILKQQFPYSLDSSALISNMCWEYALAWQKNIQDTTLLEASIQCLKSIVNVYIKKGLYNLVWNTHLKILFESTTKVINKVGKLPKERLCRQDTGLSDYQITLFINICTDFFDTFMNVIHDCYNIEKPKLKFEPFWENGNQPLVELALNQNEINFDLLHLHYQLSLCIKMIVTFAIKHQKFVSNLFDLNVLSLFFTDLQQKVQINWNKSDAKISASRVQFLIKIITASIDTVTRCDNKIYSTDHVYWMAKTLYLARFWNLDIDVLKRYQIVCLFTNGFDQLAEELIPAVTEINKLGPDLLIVAGKRLSNYLSTSEDLGEKIAAFSPVLTTYIETMKGTWSAPCPLESILSLTIQCIRCMSEEHSDYKLACLMQEACSTLQDLQK